MDFGNFFAGSADHFGVVLEWDRGIYAALQEHRPHASLCGSFETRYHLIDRIRISIFIAFVPVERAEDAIDVADVRVIWVRVDDEGDAPLRIEAIAHRLRQLREIEERGVLQKPEALFAREAFA